MSTRSQARKKRAAHYKKVKKNQFRGAKERLRLKCSELTQSYHEVLEDKSTLKELGDKLTKENCSLKK